MIYISKNCSVWESERFAKSVASRNADYSTVIEVPVNLTDLVWWRIDDDGKFRYLVKEETEAREIQL